VTLAFYQANDCDGLRRRNIVARRKMRLLGIAEQRPVLKSPHNGRTSIKPQYLRA
jgi:hypothetical protein